MHDTRHVSRMDLWRELADLCQSEVRLWQMHVEPKSASEKLIGGLQIHCEDSRFKIWFSAVIPCLRKLGELTRPLLRNSIKLSVELKKEKWKTEVYFCCVVFCSPWIICIFPVVIE